MENKTYQIWMVIEECTTDKDGNETHRDLTEEETRSAGKYGTLKEALDAMNEIYNDRKHTFQD